MEYQYLNGWADPSAFNPAHDVLLGSHQPFGQTAKKVLFNAEEGKNKKKLKYDVNY
jgi:hypothetical protein